jgi:osomolarity two-component system response regulator SKN7
MNDVLPKPFTKEGLLSMLEKHLGHLKKSPSQIDGVPPGPPPPLVQVAGKHVLKAEESPATSPATISNWTSPGTGLGMSPAASDAAGNEYSMGVAGHPSAPYHMQTGMPPPGMPSQLSFGGSPRGIAPGLGPQPGGPHSRHFGRARRRWKRRQETTDVWSRTSTYATAHGTRCTNGTTTTKSAQSDA